MGTRRGNESVRVQFVGSGDAFGDGGRFQACISVRAEGSHVLLDCGATSLVAMKRLGVDPGSVDAVLVSHLHGDHFGGLPFLVLDGQFSRREKDLVVAGPPGVRDRTLQAMEVLYHGSSKVQRRFEVRFVELAEREETGIGDVAVTAFRVPHGSGAPAYALRLSCAGRIVAYSGDTEWSEALVEVARGADLFICEAYSWDKPIKNHLAYRTLRANRARLECRRLVLTHMGPETLGHLGEVEDEVAEDGLAIELDGTRNPPGASIV
jgi:ribonuclease BN (tRNA processing enzyme)